MQAILLCFTRTNNMFKGCGSLVISQCKIDLLCRCFDQIVLVFIREKIGQGSLPYMYPFLLTEEVQRYDRGRCDMSMPTVLAHNTTKEGMTYWHSQQRKVWCEKFFSVYKVYSGCEKPMPKKYTIIGYSKRRCLNFIMLMLAPLFIPPNSCKPAIIHIQFQSTISVTSTYMYVDVTVPNILGTA